MLYEPGFSEKIIDVFHQDKSDICTLKIKCIAGFTIRLILIVSKPQIKHTYVPLITKYSNFKLSTVFVCGFSFCKKNGNFTNHEVIILFSAHMNH